MVPCKLFELRDSMTFIPIFAIRMDYIPDRCHQTWDSEVYLMKRCGYPLEHPQVIIGKVHGNGKALSDPYEWNDRTFKTAHIYILENWDNLIDGQVICVEHILGERETPKESERYGNT